MLQHVYERSRLANGVERVIVATDDERIAAAVKEFGGDLVLTGRHPTGTDRVAEVAARMDCEVVLNVQGDLPMIEPQMLSEAAEPLLDDPKLCMATLCTPIKDSVEWERCDVVKVVMDARNNALYFSRSPIPFHRDALGDLLGYRHIGLYAYRRSFLVEYARWPRGRLECAEELEQLRALEAGVTIRMVVVDNAGVEVDTADDLERARWLLEGRV